MSNGFDRYKGSPEDRFKYNGKEQQPDIGYYDYGARMYDPTTGRWFGIDPLAEKYSSMSAYIYVNNNPLRFIDPTGMEGEDAFFSSHYEGQAAQDAFRQLQEQDKGKKGKGEDPNKLYAGNGGKALNAVSIKPDHKWTAFDEALYNFQHGYLSTNPDDKRNYGPWKPGIGGGEIAMPIAFRGTVYNSLGMVSSANERGIYYTFSPLNLSSSTFQDIGNSKGMIGGIPSISVFLGDKLTGETTLLSDYAGWTEGYSVGYEGIGLGYGRSNVFDGSNFAKPKNGYVTGSFIIGSNGISGGYSYTKFLWHQKYDFKSQQWITTDLNPK